MSPGFIKKEPTEIRPTFFKAELFYYRLHNWLEKTSEFAVACRRGEWLKHTFSFYSCLDEVYVCVIGFLREDKSVKIKHDLDEVKNLLSKHVKTNIDIHNAYNKLEDVYMYIKIQISFLELPTDIIKDFKEIMKERTT